MDDARTLTNLYAYNTWANEQVFAACRGLDVAALEEAAAGTFESIAATLKHYIGVEDVYLQMLRGGTPGDAGSREEYFDHDVAWFAERAARLGAEYAALLA